MVRHAGNSRICRFSLGLMVFACAVGRGGAPPAWRKQLGAAPAWIEDPLGTPVIDRGDPGSWDHVAVDNPFVFQEAGHLYCFFEAENAEGREQIGLAVSDDLVHWTAWPRNPVLAAGPTGAWDHQAAKLPAVARHGGRYVMLYTGKDGKGNAAIGMATSKDLRHWTKEGAGPVVTGRPDAWDPVITTCPAVLSRNGELYVVYRGMKTFYTEQQLGVLVTRDLRRWRRLAGPLAGLAGVYSFAVCPTPVDDVYMAVSQRQHAGRVFLSGDLVTWQPGPLPRYDPSAIDTPSNPVLHAGRAWILYEKRDRIYRARLEADAIPPRGVGPAWRVVQGRNWSRRGAEILQSDTGPAWARIARTEPPHPLCDLQAEATRTAGEGWVGVCAAHGQGLYAFAVVHDGRKIARLFRSESGRWGEVEWVEDVPYDPPAGRPLALRLVVTRGVVRCDVAGRPVIEKRDPDPLWPVRPGLFTAGAAAVFRNVHVNAGRAP